MALSRSTLKAIDHYDEKVNSLARQRYGISGAALLAKLVKGESNDRMDAVSSANARGKAQFIPGTRQAVIKQTGGKVDPWRSTDEAVHGAVLHLTGKLGNAKGLEGYNPGMASYPKYILSQKVGDIGKQIRQQGGSTGGGGGSSRSSSGGSGQPAATQTTTQTGAGFDPGIGTSALVQLAQQQARPQAPQILPSPPQFAAQAAMPQGYQAPSAQPVQQQSSGLSDLLSSMTSGGQSIPQVETETRTTSGGRQTSKQGGSSAGQGTGDRNPIRGRHGKLIGVPHSGTHTLGNWQSDNAVDLGTPNGTVLESVADGKVVKRKGSYKGGSSRFDGIQVTIEGDDGRQYFYTHLSKSHLKPGQRIKAGQAIGRSGSANGVPHLHLGVSKGDARRYR